MLPCFVKMPRSFFLRYLLQLIVEYMTLLTPWRRRRIEKSTKYFHALLEADADGDLVLPDDDWHGGLNALREDIEETNKKSK